MPIFPPLHNAINDFRETHDIFILQFSGKKFNTNKDETAQNRKLDDMKEIQSFKDFETQIGSSCSMAEKISSYVRKATPAKKKKKKRKLVWQPVLEKENSKFKPLKLHLKIDVSHPPLAGICRLSHQTGECGTSPF